MSIINSVMEFKHTIVEELGSTPLAPSANKRVTTSLDGDSSTLSPTTSPTVNAGAYGSGSLSGGAKTLDLTAIPSTGGVSVDLTGKKLRRMSIKNNGSSAMTFKSGASNGYTAPFSSGGQVIQPGCRLMIELLDTAPAVSSTVKTFDITGTGTDAFSYKMDFGS